jgi:hypothetical protein
MKYLIADYLFSTMEINLGPVDSVQEAKDLIDRLQLMARLRVDVSVISPALKAASVCRIWEEESEKTAVVTNFRIFDETTKKLHRFEL